MSDLDILEFKPAGHTETIRTMTAMAFLSWLTKKLDGLPRYGEAAPLVMLVSAPPMSRTMPENDKIKCIRIIQKLGVQI